MRKLVIAAIAGSVLVFVLGVRPVHAQTVIVGESKTLGIPTASTDVSLDFYLDRTGPMDGMPLLVGNFQLRLELVGPGAGSLVSLVGVDEAIAHSQAFALDQTLVPNATSAFASTFNFEDPFEIGDGRGLLSARLRVEPGAIGEYQLRILTGVDDTQLTDPADFLSPLAFNVQHASIAIVPEPASLCILASGVAVLCACGRFVQQTASTSRRGRNVTQAGFNRA